MNLSEENNLSCYPVFNWDADMCITMFGTMVGNTDTI